MARATTSNGTVDGTVFYDGECSICTRGARRFESVLARRRIALAPLQTPDACARLGIAEEDRLKEKKALQSDIVSTQETRRTEQSTTHRWSRSLMR